MISHKKSFERFKKNLFKKTEQIHSREIDGVSIDGLRKVEKVKNKPKNENFKQSEDWVLERLFKKAGAIIETAIDQRSIKQE